MLVVIYSCSNSKNAEYKETAELANKQAKDDSISVNEELWTVPDTSSIPHDEFGRQFQIVKVNLKKIRIRFQMILNQKSITSH